MNKKLFISLAPLLASAAFAVTPAAAQEPHWYGNGTLLKGKPIAVKTKGPLAFHNLSSGVVINCTVADEEEIANPKGSGAGTDKLTHFALSGCSAKPSPCGTAKIEVLAHKLPWLSHLLSGPPIRDVVEGINFEVKCKPGTFHETLTGTLKPRIVNASVPGSKSVLAFGAGSGELQGPERRTAVTGEDGLDPPTITITAWTIVPTETYLALGDSLAFGYSLQLFNENETGVPATTEPPTAFEEAPPSYGPNVPNGYANDYLNKLAAGGAPLQLANDGCPGETTDSMIGNGALATAMAPLGATGEAPCAYHYGVLGYHLHNDYVAPQSQLENALEVIKAESTTTTPVKTISLNIGFNDVLRQIKKCEAEVATEFGPPNYTSQYGATPEEAVKNCIILNASPTFKHIITNISAMLYVIRNGAAYGGVNYTGKIIVQGYYDPYGRVFCATGPGSAFSDPVNPINATNAPASCVPGPELLESSNSLLGILNFQEEKAVTEPPFGACYANPQPTFNPATASVGMPEHEPFQLQTLTNMDNKTESGNPPKPNGDGKKSDLHPTPLGYEELANIMRANC